MIKAVTDGLTLLLHRLEGRSAARLYDLNIVSEDFFKDLLNCLRNLALVNLNNTGLRVTNLVVSGSKIF